MTKDYSTSGHRPGGTVQRGGHHTSALAAFNAFRSLVRWLPLVAGAVLLVLVIAWMSGAFHAKVQPGSIPVSGVSAEGRELVKVTLLPEIETVEATGTIQPRYMNKVESQILATVLDVAVRPGDRVEEGQLLLTLDDRETQAELRGAEAALTAAAAELTVRQKDYDRYKLMYAGQAVTKEQYDQVKGAYEVAQAQAERAKEQIARIKVALTYTRIQANTGGIVLNRFVDPGDLAAPGKMLLSLHNPKDLELHASVREDQARDVRLGMELPVRVDAVSLATTGKVREIVPEAQVASRSVLVKLALSPDQTVRLYAGMFGRLLLPVGSAKRIVMPSDAVQHVGQLDFVDVVNSHGMVERRYVRTGRRYGQRIEVLSGLNASDSVAKPALSPSTDSVNQP